MTPGQRDYDTALVGSMRSMAQWVFMRSRKIADTLNAGADRIEALSAAVELDPPVVVDEHGFKKQPASTPDQAVPDQVRVEDGGNNRRSRAGKR